MADTAPGCLEAPQLGLDVSSCPELPDGGGGTRPSELQNLWAAQNNLFVPPPSETWEGVGVEVSLLCPPEVSLWLFWGSLGAQLSLSAPGDCPCLVSWSRISGEVP